MMGFEFVHSLVEPFSVTRWADLYQVFFGGEESRLAPLRLKRPLQGEVGGEL